MIFGSVSGYSAAVLPILATAFLFYFEQMTVGFAFIEPDKKGGLCKYW